VKLLVVGAESQTGAALETLLEVLKQQQGIESCKLAASKVNLLEKAEVEAAVRRLAPTQIINVTAFNAIGDIELAEHDASVAQRCHEWNTVIPAVLAEVASTVGVPLIHHSSSLVFDGAKVHPYSEEDSVSPQSCYARAKWEGEQAIRKVLMEHIILRTDWVFSVEHSQFFQRYIDACKKQQGQLTILQNRFSPTPASDVARILVGIAQQLDCGADGWGTYHYCAQQPLSQEAFVEQILQEAARYDDALAQELPKLQIGKQPVVLPYIANSVVNGKKLFETFGIKARSRNAEVSAAVRALYKLPPLSAIASSPAYLGDVSDARTVITQEKAASSSKSARLPSKKGEGKKG
jgi:dTDP-4-dehydrorhamnose reductase